jgi:hypothetical protein
VNVQLPFGMKMPIKIPVGGSKVKTVGAVAGVAVLGVVGAIGAAKMKGKKARPDYITYSAVKLDEKNVDADRLIPTVDSAARAWRKDAAFWSINIQAVRPDGTFDASGGGASIEFVSPSGVNAYAPKQREDSIKKFSFGAGGIDYHDLWGAQNRWDIKETPSLPHCGIKMVMKQLAAKGLTGNKTAHVTFDPQFAWDAWHVLSDDPQINAFFSTEDCSPVEPK